MDPERGVFGEIFPEVMIFIYRNISPNTPSEGIIPKIFFNTEKFF